MEGVRAQRNGNNGVYTKENVESLTRRLQVSRSYKYLSHTTTKPMGPIIDTSEKAGTPE